MPLNVVYRPFASRFDLVNASVLTMYIQQFIPWDPLLLAEII